MQMQRGSHNNLQMLPITLQQMNDSNQQTSHTCIVNLGLFRSGTTTLVEAAKALGLKTFREFPKLTCDEYKQLLIDPKRLVQEWWDTKGGREVVVMLIRNNHLICDGWIAILALLPHEELWSLQRELRRDGIVVHYIATTRNVDATVKSELQHWVVHDLEQKSGLSSEDRARLESYLYSRAMIHAEQIIQLTRLPGDKCCILKLERMNDWSPSLATLTSFPSTKWYHALDAVGVSNANPQLPVEGILLTLRVGIGLEAQESTLAVSKLLDSIEADSLCRYLVVLGIDSDEAASPEAEALKTAIANRQRCESCSLIVNQLEATTGPFRICDVWHHMADKAWIDGADWVVLLGDDIKIDSKCHYRCFYRAFLDLSEQLMVS